MNLFTRASALTLSGLAALALAGLSACAPDTSAPVLQARIVAPAAAEATAEATVQTAAAAPTPLVFEDGACLECHTDQERLTELALPVEEVESHSSGPG